MGPWATVALFDQITRRTPIGREQDHLRLMIDCDPTIPDRSAWILAHLRASVAACGGDGPKGGQAREAMPESPGPYLVAAAKRLESAGAELLAMACNTAHFWYDQIASAVGIPMLNLIEVTGQAAAIRCGRGRRIGLMATEATVRMGLYPRAMERLGMELVTPDDPNLAEIVKGIWQVKQGQINLGRQTLTSQARALIARGADGLILGCTDISVVIADGDLPVPVIDSTVAMAERIIAEARGD